MIINLISGPRNVSTALMYSFAQRSDTRVEDEPFYAVYLARSGAQHPGREAVLAALPAGEHAVREKLALPRDRPVLFVKNMAHHMEVLEDPFIEGATNIFLIRDPAQILRSYAAVIDAPVMRDIGIAFQYTLFSHLTRHGSHPVVVDAADLLRDPGSVLGAICEACGLRYEQRMAHWPPGPKPYDGVWAPYWYVNVHRSTGFARPKTSSDPLPARLMSLCEEARALYDKLRPFSIKA